MSHIDVPKETTLPGAIGLGCPVGPDGGLGMHTQEPGPALDCGREEHGTAGSGLGRGGWAVCTPGALGSEQTVQAAASLPFTLSPALM